MQDRIQDIHVYPSGKVLSSCFLFKSRKEQEGDSHFIMKGTEFWLQNVALPPLSPLWPPHNKDSRDLPCIEGQATNAPTPACGHLPASLDDTFLIGARSSPAPVAEPLAGKAAVWMGIFLRAAGLCGGWDAQPSRWCCVWCLRALKSSYTWPYTKFPKFNFMCP